MRQARGLEPLDLVLHRARLVNVLSGEIYETDIGIQDGFFVGTGEYREAREIRDLAGRYVVPGLIDGHVHIESSHLCPEEFCALLLAHGVTSALADPHEIANVAGPAGIRYILECLAGLPFNGFVALPSCVPATELETSGARLTAENLAALMGDPRVIGLGEVMDYPGVLEGKEELVRKLLLPLRLRDGHAPGIGAQDLNAYYLAGISTEHECSTPGEATERLRRGFFLMLREGSAARNLLDLLPAVNSANSNRCLLVTDDRNPLDLWREGSIDHLIRLAVKAGVEPVQAVQMATINPARALGLEHLGAIAPGFQADCVILNDLERFVIDDVLWRGISPKKEQGSASKLGKDAAVTVGKDASVTVGKNASVTVEKDAPLAAERGGSTAGGTDSRIAAGTNSAAGVELSIRKESREDVNFSGNGRQGTGESLRYQSKPLSETVHLGKWSKERLQIRCPREPRGSVKEPGQRGGRPCEERETVPVRVIGIKPRSLVTDQLCLDLPVRAGLVLPDAGQDVAKLVVLERHRGSGRTGLGFVRGLGLGRGALASTVAHDSHNLVAAGMNDEDMELAVRTVAASQGGLCLTAGGRVLGHLPLPLAGLMSWEPADEVVSILAEMHIQARQLGMREGVDPFMTLAFLSLPVIPHLKLTDRGLVDGDKLCFVNLFL
ncbi:adenine deaminase [Peptococcaceae bacterium CEB3]|nr:adenine deaminase [Peptococcaceae bacterium CEB3]